MESLRFQAAFRREARLTRPYVEDDCPVADATIDKLQYCRRYVPTRVSCLGHQHHHHERYLATTPCFLSYKDTFDTRLASHHPRTHLHSSTNMSTPAARRTTRKSGSFEPLDPTSMHEILGACTAVQEPANTLRFDEYHPHPLLEDITALAQAVYAHLAPERAGCPPCLDGTDFWADLTYETRDATQPAILHLELWEGPQLSAAEREDVPCAYFVLDLAWDVLVDRRSGAFVRPPRAVAAARAYQSLKVFGRRILWEQYREKKRLAIQQGEWKEAMEVDPRYNWGIVDGGHPWARLGDPLRLKAGSVRRKAGSAHLRNSYNAGNSTRANGGHTTSRR